MHNEFPLVRRDLKVLHFYMIVGSTFSEALQQVKNLLKEVKYWNWDWKIVWQNCKTWQESIFVLFKITPPYNTASASLICNVAVTEQWIAEPEPKRIRYTGFR